MTNKTLLDEFAMAAFPTLCERRDLRDKDSTKLLVAWSYKVAQSMMDERKKYMPTKEKE